MAKEIPNSKDAALTDEELEKAVGGTARATGAAGEAAAVRHVAAASKAHRDEQERREETGN